MSSRQPGQVLVQLLLSLLLLVSQQLAMAHGYTHVPRLGNEQAAGLTQSQGQASDSDDGTKAPAADHLCAQCLSADQLAYALGVPSYSFKAVAPSYLPLISTTTPPACLQVVCVFQPRAPPRV